jgi:hypothetical protein
MLESDYLVSNDSLNATTYEHHLGFQEFIFVLRGAPGAFD